jgi:hypothetical protein
MFHGEGGAFTSSIWGKSGKPNLRIYNNIFITNGRINPAAVSNNVWSDGAGTFAIDNNIWWRVEGEVRFRWGTKVITNWLRGWQAKGFDRSGFAQDPGVAGPLGSGPWGYVLMEGSPAIDAGRLVEVLRGMPSQDAFGVPFEQGQIFDIGASEYPPPPRAQ